MTETSGGQWAAVSWPYVATHAPINYYNQQSFELYSFGGLQANRNKRSGYVYAAYQLLLEFKDTSFAEGERDVLTHLSKLLDTQSLSDVNFVVKKEKIGAHSAIVASGSLVLCAMLEEDKFKEGRTKEVKIDDIDPLVFKEMLRYLYTGKSPKLEEDDMTEPLFLAADKYQIEALKNCCEQTLIKKLNEKAVIHYLVLAHLYTAPRLLEASLIWMEKNKKKVKLLPEWKELIKTYPDLFFLAANRMIG